MTHGSAKSITDVLASVHDLLLPLTSEDRKRVISGALALLGENLPPSHVRDDGLDEIEYELPPAALRWMKQNGVTVNHLEEVFHIEDGSVELIATSVPGVTKKDGTAHAYLLCGIRNLLQRGVAEFADGEAVAYAQHIGVYDSNNHTSNRKAIGNKLTGSRASGFKLAAPGLREAADIIKSIASAQK